MAGTKRRGAVHAGPGVHARRSTRVRGSVSRRPALSLCPATLPFSAVKRQLLQYEMNDSLAARGRLGRQTTNVLNVPRVKTRMPDTYMRKRNNWRCLRLVFPIHNLFTLNSDTIV